MKPQASSTDVQATSAATQAVGVRRAGLSAFAIPSRFIRPLRTAAIDDSRPLPNQAATPSRFRTPRRPAGACVLRQRRMSGFGSSWTAGRGRCCGGGLACCVGLSVSAGGCGAHINGGGFVPSSFQEEA